MNSRERLQKALAHSEGDRVPFDLGGSVVTGIAVQAYEKLIPVLGLSVRPVKVQSLYSQTASIDEDVFQALQVDTRPLNVKDPSGWKLQIEASQNYRSFTDEWHIQYAMPDDGSSGYAVVKHPFSNATTLQEIEQFPWPDGMDAARFVNLAEKARQLAEVDQVGVILETNIGGVFEWPAWLCGTEKFLMDLAEGSPIAEALIERITEYKIAFWETALSQAGEYIDLVRESDDFGSQAGLLISPRMYQKYFKPAHARICETIRKHTQAAICLHSCGSVWELIPGFIEAGFTVLNPIQTGAAKMDLVSLKREFGKDLCFWGGSVDSQTVLPYAPAEQVKEQARKSLEVMAPGGGYIFSPINMINADVPPENILALAQAVAEYGIY